MSRVFHEPEEAAPHPAARRRVMLVVAIGVIVASNVVYHLAQKSIPASAPPALSLLVTYVVAIAGTLLVLPFFPLGGSIANGLRQLNWASAAVGIAIVGVELGFLLAYRWGLRVSLGSAAANAAVALVLVPTGLLVFRERLSAANVVGIVLCIAGLLLVVAR
jgi:drug/metabolite transporter (DMT)-like permease